jgi:hypothetical protein
MAEGKVLWIGSISCEGGRSGKAERLISPASGLHGLAGGEPAFHV